jgi:hypothetical protein
MTYWDIVKMAEKWLMTYPQHRKSADGGEVFRQFVASEVGGDEWNYGSQHALRLARLNMDLGQRGYCPPESADASYRIFYGDMPWEVTAQIVHFANKVLSRSDSDQTITTP